MGVIALLIGKEQLTCVLFGSNSPAYMGAVSKTVACIQFLRAAQVAGIRAVVKVVCVDRAETFLFLQDLGGTESKGVLALPEHFPQCVRKQDGIFGNLYIRKY